MSPTSPLEGDNRGQRPQEAGSPGSIPTPRSEDDRPRRVQSRPPSTFIDLLTVVVQSRQATTNLVRLLAATAGLLSIVTAGIGFLAVHFVHPVSVSSSTLTLIGSLVSAGLGTSIGLGAAYRARRASTTALSDLEKVLQDESTDPDGSGGAGES
jgi:hypothetical protein